MDFDFDSFKKKKNNNEGSNDQLENTERCNGIIQEDPDVIVQSTEVIDILFHQIKMSTYEAANIYGNVLCQIACDLVPPKELLTRVIKELLTISQPHCQVIAKILFQVRISFLIEIDTKNYLNEILYIFFFVGVSFSDRFEIFPIVAGLVVMFIAKFSNISYSKGHVVFDGHFHIGVDQY